MHPMASWPHSIMAEDNLVSVEHAGVILHQQHKRSMI